jgi:hypothetical protein
MGGRLAASAVPTGLSSGEGDGEEDDASVDSEGIEFGT